MQILEIGSYLGKRYEVVEKIGEGGMAEVYRCRDTFLNRAVAVKVLRPQYASDEEFVERFRREAQAAASLSHPNVVSIFDVGEEKGIHYIIMEYVKGKNLKEIIRERAPLTSKEAAEIGLQICDALSHAHQNGIIHRDVKPHNILITLEGRVKVTDFGIARAANSASLTETGIIIGSVHYFSPEQAKGAAVGVESDLYSLGVILYELLTGKVPFSADSPIATALQHISGTALELRELNPQVPESLEEIVMRALQKEPEKRYEAASGFGIALKNFLSSKEGLHEEQVNHVSDDTIVIKPGKTLVKRKGDVTLIESMEEDDLMAEKRKKRQSKKRKNTTKKKGGILKGVIGFLFIIALFTFIAIWGLQKLPALLYVPEVAVPNLQGKTLQEAERLLKERKLVPKLWREVYDSEVANGLVMGQTPEPEEIVKVNRTVLLTVSKGPEMIEVPTLLGKELREAEIALSEAGLLIGSKDYDNSSDIEDGRIASQIPLPRTLVKKGTYVDIIISKGKLQTNKVPDIRGLSRDAAEKVLKDLGFDVGSIIEDYSNEFAIGIVMAQDPPPESQLQPGSKVDFMISRGLGEPLNNGSIKPGEDDTSGSGWMKEYEVAIVVPPGPSRQRVRIVATDIFGEREAYNELHRPGERISKYIQGTGTLNIKVYIDGNLYEEFPKR